MKYYVVKTENFGSPRKEYKRTKCLDYYSRDKSVCWQFSKQGAQKIADRSNAALAPYWRDKIHFSIEPVE